MFIYGFSVFLWVPPSPLIKAAEMKFSVFNNCTCTSVGKSKETHCTTYRSKVTTLHLLFFLFRSPPAPGRQNSSPYSTFPASSSVADDCNNKDVSNDYANVNPGNFLGLPTCKPDEVLFKIAKEYSQPAKSGQNSHAGCGGKWKKN